MAGTRATSSLSAIRRAGNCALVAVRVAEAGEDGAAFGFGLVVGVYGCGSVCARGKVGVGGGGRRLGARVRVRGGIEVHVFEVVFGGRRGRFEVCGCEGGARGAGGAEGGVEGLAGGDGGVGVRDGRAGGDVEGAAVGVEGFAGDGKRLVFGEGATVRGGGGGGGGAAPEGAFVGG